MRKIACFFAVALCVACNYGVGDVSGEDLAGKSSGELSVVIECESLATRAVTDYTEPLAEENKINKIDVLVFEKSTGKLNASKVVSGVGDQCVFSITTGEKTVYAVANAPDLSGVLTVSQLEQVINDLSATDYMSDGFVMVGKQDCSVRLGEVSQPVIALKRMVARIVVRKIRNGIASQYGTIGLDCVYLANANKIQTLGGVSSVPVNVGGYADAAKTQPIGKNGVKGACPGYMFREMGPSLPQGTSVMGGYHMYCHPTNANAKTCMYLLVTIAGGQYYYRVPLQNGLQANKTYSVDVEFVNLGSTIPPDGDLQKGEIKAVVSVSGWDAGDSYEVEF